MSGPYHYHAGECLWCSEWAESAHNLAVLLASKGVCAATTAMDHTKKRSQGRLTRCGECHSGLLCKKSEVGTLLSMLAVVNLAFAM